MSTQERQDSLVHILRRRSDWTTDQLASDLGVSRRTVLRDLNRLRDRGFHISALAGPGGGVRLEPTSVMLTSQLHGDEVVALILSVAIARATPSVPFARGAEKALEKIESALPRQRLVELRAITERILIDDTDHASIGPIGSVDPTLVGVFEETFTGKRLLTFDYTDARRAQTQRTVEPHGLLVRAPLWYVIAWDPTRNAPRLFRADRVRAPKATDRPFSPRPHDLVTGICPDARPALDRPRPTGTTQ